MEFLKKAGLALSSASLILCFPLVKSVLSENLGKFGHFSGPVSFAAGLSLLVSYLAFQAGKHYQENRKN